ncbi:protein of unknown function, partial [Pseudomonas inefficax]
MGAGMPANTGVAGAMHRVGFFAAKAAPIGYADRLRIQFSKPQRSRLHKGQKQPASVSGCAWSFARNPRAPQVPCLQDASDQCAQTCGRRQGGRWHHATV